MNLSKHRYFVCALHFKHYTRVSEGLGNKGNHINTFPRLFKERQLIYFFCAPEFLQFDGAVFHSNNQLKILQCANWHTPLDEKKASTGERM